jgi:hypothetical protein
MATDPSASKAPPISLAISLSDPAALPSILNSLRALDRRPDSIRVSVRGTSSALIDLLSQAGVPGGEISAVLSLGGDLPMEPSAT